MIDSSQLTIWRLLDGRPGHENQVIGLSEAISRHYAAQCFDMAVDDRMRGLRSLLPGRINAPPGSPSPDLLIGAGHATHIPLLACQRRFGGKTVVIMKPSLPVGLFDICLIPAHDRLNFLAANVIRTEGALNRVRPARCKNDQRGLFLIGGPSRHFHWSVESVMEQVRHVVSRTPHSWTVVTSDRTPKRFAEDWRRKHADIPLVQPAEQSSDWLPRQLAECGVVWVTCDSVSMIYESLTAGARVGLLELAATNSGRVSRSVERLLEQEFATSFQHWLSGKPLPVSVKTFSESDRCSTLVVRHCLKSQHGSLRPKGLAELLKSYEWMSHTGRQLGEPGEFISASQISHR